MMAIVNLSIDSGGLQEEQVRSVREWILRPPRGLPASQLGVGTAE